jgi:hypothetical protein
MSIVAGRPDQGKGLIMAHIAAEVSRTKFREADGKVRYGRVLYSAVEDSHELMSAPRLRAAGANMKQIHLWRFAIPADWDELQMAMLTEQPDLLVMDPLAAHLSSGISRHSDNIRVVLNPLTKLIEQTGTAALMVEHVLKNVSPNAHPLQAIGGSGSGLAAAARMAYLFGVDPADEDRRILANIKSNIRESPRALGFELDQAIVKEVGEVPFLIYDDELDIDARKLVVVERRGHVGRPPDKRSAAAEWLTNFLYLDMKCKPTRVGVIEEDSKQYGMASKTLRRAAADIEVVKNPPGGGPKVTWALPDALIKRLNAANGVPEPENPPDAVAFKAPQVPDVSDLDEQIAALLGSADAAKEDEGKEK